MWCIVIHILKGLGTSGVEDLTQVTNECGCKHTHCCMENMRKLCFYIRGLFVACELILINKL